MNTQKPTLKAQENARANKKTEQLPSDTPPKTPTPQKEIGGFEHTKEPTRFGDWEVGGRCSDF